MIWKLMLLLGVLANAQEDPSLQLLSVKRVYVDRLTGGATAAQMRDLLITALQGSKLFVLTENEARADAFLRGAAEDLVYTDTFKTSDNITVGMRGSNAQSSSAGTGINRAAESTDQSRGLNIGERESSDIKERKHEAFATVRLVNKDGDVMWSTTQESTGAKFRGASAEVADRIAKNLLAEYERLKKR